MGRRSRGGHKRTRRMSQRKSSSRTLGTLWKEASGTSWDCSSESEVRTAVRRNRVWRRKCKSWRFHWHRLTSTPMPCSLGAVWKNGCIHVAEGRSSLWDGSFYFFTSSIMQNVIKCNLPRHSWKNRKYWFTNLWNSLQVRDMWVW